MDVFKDVPDKLAMVVSRLASLTDQGAKAAGSGGASSASGEAPQRNHAEGASGGGVDSPRPHQARAPAHAVVTSPGAGVGPGSDGDDDLVRVSTEGRGNDEDSLCGEATSAFRVFSCSPSAERMKQISFNDNLLVLTLSPEERNSLTARSRVLPEASKIPRLPPLRTSDSNPQLATQLANMQIPASLLIAFLTRLNVLIRNTATAWITLASMIDQVDWDEGERQDFDRVLEALAANVKLEASLSADTVAAAHAAQGDAASFARIFRGLQSSPTPSFVSAERFESMKKAADSANSIAAIKSALRIVPPNAPQRKKRRFAWGNGQAKKHRASPEAAASSSAAPQQPQQQPAGQAPPQRSGWRKPFRGNGKPSGQS